VGSADRTFYALNPDGTPAWTFATGEIIDSAALLDDRGRVYFGSGDGHLYALDRSDGHEVWRFQADDPSVNHAFIRWFEGNVALAPDGTLVAGNDNWFLYGLDRDTGALKWRFATPDQTWSLPAFDPVTGDLFVGNNNLLLPAQRGNVFSLDAGGKKRWQAGTLGSNAASPLLLAGGTVVLGGFDGFVHAFAAADGAERWSAGERDHVYASPALAPDGTIIQAGADGTLYSLDPADGHVRWAYDWGNPLRSSPAVDGEGHVYVGTGDGRLLVVNPNGTLRWALRLIHADRDDVNASPALGPHAIVVAGESGEVFQVPPDFCLRPSEAANPDCLVGAGEPLLDDGAFVLFTTRYGSTLTEAPATVAAHEPLAFSLMVRQGGDTRLALIDTPSLQVTADPPVPLTVTVSAARQFFTVQPDAPLEAGPDGRARLHVSGSFLLDPQREGLAFTGGVDGGGFDHVFSFALDAGHDGPLPLPYPANPGTDPAGTWELSRLAVPLPTILPSYNQIGFDSHHILIGLVEDNAEGGVAWGLEVQPGPDGALSPIPDTSAIFPFSVRYQQGRLTLENTQGFSVGIQGTTIGFQLFRLAAMLDAQGSAGEGAALTATTRCGDVPLYGLFMRKMGLCHPDTDLMVTYGAALLEPYQGGTPAPPEGVGTVTFQAAGDHVTATLSGSTLQAAGHTLGLLLVDAGTGAPVSLDYGKSLARTANPDGSVASVTLSFKREAVPDRVRAWLMVDTWPAARAELAIPAPSGPWMGLLQFHVQHDLAQPGCAPAGCYLEVEDATDALPAYLETVRQHSNLAVLHWDKPIPYLAFSEPLPAGADRVGFYNARLDEDLRARLDAFAAHFAAMPRRYLAVSLLGGARDRYQPLRLGADDTAQVGAGCPDFSPGSTQQVALVEDGRTVTRTFEPGVAYERFLLYLRARLHPDYMALLVEANLLRESCPERWPGLAALYLKLYDAVRADAGPGLPLFATLTWQQLLKWDEKACFDLVFSSCSTPANATYAPPDPDACFPMDPAPIHDLDQGGRLDVLALSFYPDYLMMAPPGADTPVLELSQADWDGVAPCWMHAPYGPLADPMPRLDALGWSKPVAMAEWSARSCRSLVQVSTADQTFWASPDGSLDTERFWMEHVLAAARDRHFPFVTWSFLQDYPPLGKWLVDQGVMDPWLHGVLNTWPCSGVLTADGQPKPGVTDAWSAALQGQSPP
jgi:outer membrane protein assembly factor BamB